MENISGNTIEILFKSSKCLISQENLSSFVLQGAHSHIRGLGLDDALDARMVSQA